MIRVGYITGLGRSGSTVVNITLGRHPDGIATGELGNLSRRVWHNDEYGSCSVRDRACAFRSAHSPAGLGPAAAALRRWLTPDAKFRKGPR